MSVFLTPDVNRPQLAFKLLYWIVVAISQKLPYPLINLMDRLIINSLDYIGKVAVNH